MAHGKCWRAVLACLLLFLLLGAAAGLNCTSFGTVNDVYQSCYMEALRSGMDLERVWNLRTTLTLDQYILTVGGTFCREAWPVLTSCFSQGVSSCQNKTELEDILSGMTDICEDGSLSSLVKNVLLKEITAPFYLDDECLRFEPSASCRNLKYHPILVNETTTVVEEQGVDSEDYARCWNRVLDRQPHCGSLGAVRVQLVVKFLVPGYFGAHFTPQALALLLGHAA